MDVPMREADACRSEAHQDVCIDTDVEVIPTVHAGPVTTKCVEKTVWAPCAHENEGGDHHCRFGVRQVIRVTVPLTFGATAEAKITRTVCHQPKPGPCPPTTRGAGPLRGGGDPSE
jgi:hypothetical protein